ncbi:MAG: hypothetical protein Q8J69_03110 [Sphingobacteriaceae bacterium]|nr:hypothetical protein [Sphingobacteriaceae bacterium]
MSNASEQAGKVSKKAAGEVAQQPAADAASNTLMHFVLGLALGGGLVAGMQARLWWLELLCLGGVLLYVLLRSGLTKSMQKRAAARKQ